MSSSVVKNTLEIPARPEPSDHLMLLKLLHAAAAMKVAFSSVVSGVWVGRSHTADCWGHFVPQLLLEFYNFSVCWAVSSQGDLTSRPDIARALEYLKL